MSQEKPTTDRDLLVGLLDSDQSPVAQGVAFLLRQNEELCRDMHALKSRVTELEKAEPPRFDVVESRTGKILSILASSEQRLRTMERATSRIQLVWQAIGAGVVALAIELFRIWSAH